MNHHDFPRILMLSLVIWILVLPVTASGKGLTLSPAPLKEPTWDTTGPEPAPASSPPESPTVPTASPPIKLQVEKEGIPKAVLFRQLNPQIYPKFEAKTKPLQATLKQTLAYLDSLTTGAPSLQRLSAFSAEASLEWYTMEQAIQPEEKAFRSYQLMREAVNELRSLSNYWITSERVKRVFRGTLREEQADRAILAAKREKIRQALTALQELETLKNQMNAELPN